MTELVLAALVFAGGHFAISSTPLRRHLVRAVGEPIYLGLYSVGMLAALVWLANAYQAAPEIVVWHPPTALRHLSLTLMPLAAILVFAGFSSANPTAVGAERSAGSRKALAQPQGILAVTRHPVMWGIGLWGIVHLLAVGDAASMVLFGSLALLALLGTLAIDAKKRQTLGDAWPLFAAATSNLPFVAALQGRARIRLAEIGGWRIGTGLLIYLALLFLHPYVFGASPLAN